MNSRNREHWVLLHRSLLFSLCLCFADLAVGQTPAISAQTTIGASGDFPAVRVAVSMVGEYRGSQERGSIILNLSITGEGLPPGARVKQVTVTKAVDNLGNVLGSSRAVGLSPFLTGSVSISPATVRKAKSLVYAEGTIELFLPSEGNGSLVRIPNVLTHAGQIKNPTFAKLSFEFQLLRDQASWDNAKNQGPDLHEGATSPDFPNGMGFLSRDPASRLASFELQAADGTVIRPIGSSTSGTNEHRLEGIRLPTPLPADTQLAFYLWVPEAIKTVPFRVEDIVLP
jgi:hypothetical protein